MVAYIVASSWSSIFTLPIEERIYVTGRRGRRYKQLLEDLREKRGYCILKEETLDHTTTIFTPVQLSQILRSAHTVYLCVLCGSENKQRLFL
jgi:hypothetical protein